MRKEDGRAGGGTRVVLKKAAPRTTPSVSNDETTHYLRAGAAAGPVACHCDGP
jgi:hypothetical protein